MDYSYLSNLDYNAGIYIRLSQEDKDKLDFILNGIKLERNPS